MYPEPGPPGSYSAFSIMLETYDLTKTRLCARFSICRLSKSDAVDGTNKLPPTNDKVKWYGDHFTPIIFIKLHIDSALFHAFFCWWDLNHKTMQFASQFWSPSWIAEDGFETMCKHPLGGESLWAKCCPSLLVACPFRKKCGRLQKSCVPETVTLILQPLCITFSYKLWMLCLTGLEVLRLLHDELALQDKTHLISCCTIAQAFCKFRSNIWEHFQIRWYYGTAMEHADRCFATEVRYLLAIVSSSFPGILFGCIGVMY